MYNYLLSVVTDIAPPDVTKLYARNVASGVALLDANVPGWRGQLDVSCLDISDGRRCVLGQLYGSYIVGVMRLCPELQQDSIWLLVAAVNDWAARHGFEWVTKHRGDAILQALWVAAIIYKREQA